MYKSNLNFITKKTNLDNFESEIFSKSKFKINI